MVVCDVSEGKLLYHDFEDSTEAHKFAARLKTFYDGLPRKYGDRLVGRKGRRTKITEVVFINFKWELVNDKFSIELDADCNWLPRLTANSIRDDFVEEFPVEYKTV